MSYTDFDFPHSHMYDSDLRELIAMYKKLVDDYNELVTELRDLNEWRQTHNAEYAELVRRLAIVENEINEFEAEIKSEFADLENKLEIKVDKLIDDTHAELERIKKEFEAEIALAIKNMQAEIESMKIEIRHAKDELENSITANNEFIFRQVEQRLNDFINNLPDYEDLIIYNPVRGIQTNVQIAILDLYDQFRIFGLTAEQYDSLRLTAQQYDSMGITALDYERWGYKLLHYPDPDYYMRDPFTGLIVRTQVVIYELTELHKDNLTASEYDSIELTAEEYDELGLTAYVYDWYGIVLFGYALTAEEYDNLGLTAQQYDDKRLDAWKYDAYGKLLLSA